MRKLIVSSFISLDGVVESPMTWASRYFDEECKTYALQRLAEADYFLLGRVAYQLFSTVWPQVKGNPYIDRINGMKKLVASTTIKDLSWNASLLGGNVTTALKRIKEQDGGDIIKYGITQLDRTLLSDQLIDEYHLWIMPARVGDGKRAFADVDPSLLTLDLLGTHTFDNGVIILKYRVH